MPLPGNVIQNSSIDAQTLINDAPLSRYQWLIAIICFLIVFVDGIDTAAMGFIAPALAQDWGVDRSQLGPVMSAALGGMIFGALLSGPAADRFGRKVVLILSMLVFGGFSLASAYAGNLDTLVILRFLTGIGLGAAMPNATTLFSEYCPDRIRSLLVTCMFCGYNLGMATGGFISGWMIPAYGWHSLFLLGGWAPLALTVLVIFVLPESYRFLIVRGGDTEKVRRILSHIAPERVQGVTHFHVPEEKTQGASKNSLAMLFSVKYAKGTLLLWLTYFMGLVVIYLLTSWLPTLMRETGASMERAAFIGGLFQFGGVVSALFVGWAMDRFNPHRVIAGFYFVAGVFAFTVGQSLGNPTLLAVLILCAGIAINGAQSAMPALSARFYQTQCRATGVAWMSGIGRFGAVFGAWIGAVLLGNNWTFTDILNMLLIPATAAAAAVFLKSLVSHTDAP
ncbi:AAHS family 4-hydroxybenzoate transporter-like MFS transporter [Advenella incenata]|jgi:AAHS family 4-hydroxybenzoate transporter-like MFS transporter|uniref:AAHS family 4-hydroxybenzoate transporter-like MFS transporter n=1 Tax=Advenella incenata TaxID=267800 RepID=A0A4Q7VEE4_9BURK|nr:MFS transporter [Advenella incenata]RZT94464.1 AAHS family 4-hydroxybenzoate transporter-like MFS transporter [Advenella incenata]